MAFVGPLDSFNSQPIQTKVGTTQTNIFTATSTKVAKDSSGKVTGGATTLYYSATAGNYTPAATTADGGKTWTYLKDSNGKEILGSDAKKSLEQGALKTNTQQQVVSATKKGPLGGGGLTPEEQKVILSSTQNTSTSTETGDPIGGEGGTVASESNVGPGGGVLGNLAGSIKSSETTRPISNYPENRLLRYPLDMSGKQDCITFTMLEYAPRKFSSSSSDFAKGEAQSKREGSEKRRGKTVTLPIQPTVSDSNNVKWGAEDMNALQAVAAAAAMSTIGGGPEAAAAAVTGAADFITGKGNSSIKALIATGFAEQAAQVRGLLTRATGGIINPNTELLFQGPDLRTFNFSFSLSAREPDEAKNIRNIIRFFKQGMSVKRADTGLFLKSPNTFEIKYMFGETKEHPWINKIKECVLTSCTVNYTPAGNYATYEDGSMTQYDLTLSFSELEPIYDDDYAEADKAIGGGLDSSIGY